MSECPRRGYWRGVGTGWSTSLRDRPYGTVGTSTIVGTLYGKGSTTSGC